MFEEYLQPFTMSAFSSNLQTCTAVRNTLQLPSSAVRNRDKTVSCVAERRCLPRPSLLRWVGEEGWRESLLLKLAMLLGYISFYGSRTFCAEYMCSCSQKFSSGCLWFYSLSLPPPPPPPPTHTDADALQPFAYIQHGSTSKQLCCPAPCSPSSSTSPLSLQRHHNHDHHDHLQPIRHRFKERHCCKLTY